MFRELVGDKITLVAGERLLVEGHGGIAEYSEEEVVVRLKRGKIVVKGAGLSIDEINGEEVHISGAIYSVERSAPYA